MRRVAGQAFSHCHRPVQEAKTLAGVLVALRAPLGAETTLDEQPILRPMIVVAQGAVLGEWFMDDRFGRIQIVAGHAQRLDVVRPFLEDVLIADRIMARGALIQIDRPVQIARLSQIGMAIGRYATGTELNGGRILGRRPAPKKIANHRVWVRAIRESGRNAFTAAEAVRSPACRL